MKNKVNYKIKFYINMVIILVQVVILAFLFNKYDNSSIVGQTPCADKFQCRACQNGKQYCSAINDYGEIYDIKCPCQDN